jgi:hypothetical protein
MRSRSSTRRITTARLAVAALAMAAASLGLASPASAVLWRVSKNHFVSYAGIVGKAHPTNVTRSAPPSTAQSFDAIGGNLDYSGGPVMPSSTNYVVVWRPSTFASNYESGQNCGSRDSNGTLPACASYLSGLSTFFQDLAHDSGTTANSDSVSTQYNDSSGHWAGGPNYGQYSASYGGVLTDTDPYPASGCPGAPQNGVCLTDAQLQTELQSFLSQQGEPAGSMTHEYFLVTPPGVASCIGRDAQGVWQCSGNAVSSASVHDVFCAYHGMTATTGHYIYANVPDLVNLDGCDPFVTTSPGGNYFCSVENTCYFNQSWADGVLSAVSHEHNESVTDPQPNNAWTDWGSQAGGEIGDKCPNDALDDPGAQADHPNGHDNFGEATPYNEVINGHYYLLQREWSNDGKQCLDHWSLQLGESFPAPSFVISGRNGTTISLNAGASCTGNAACPSGSEYVWQFNDNVSGGAPQNRTIETSSPKISHKFPRRGVYTVALTIMGPTGLSHGTAQVVHVYAKPVVQIAASIPRRAKAPISFSSRGTTHDPALTIRSYSWRFGDGKTSTAANPRHTYAHAGTYTVRLRVTDSAGQSSAAAGKLTVKP